MEPRLIAACLIGGGSLLAVVLRIAFLLPQRRREKLRRRGVKTYENARMAERHARRSHQIKRLTSNVPNAGR